MAAAGHSAVEPRSSKRSCRTGRPVRFSICPAVDREWARVCVSSDYPTARTMVRDVVGLTGGPYVRRIRGRQRPRTSRGHTGRSTATRPTGRCQTRDQRSSRELSRMATGAVHARSRRQVERLPHLQLLRRSPHEGDEDSKPSQHGSVTRSQSGLRPRRVRPCVAARAR